MGKIFQWIGSAVVASLLFSTALVVAQDSTSEATATDTIVCDSDHLDINKE